MELAVFKGKLKALRTEGDDAIAAVQEEAKASGALQDVIQMKVNTVKEAVSNRIDVLVGEYVNQLGVDAPTE